MDTSSLHPHWALAITPRNQLEGFLAQLSTILDCYKILVGQLTPADLMAWSADLTPKLRTFAGSPEYQALLEMPNTTDARELFRDSLLSIFNESFREVLVRSGKAIDSRDFCELKELLSRAPFPPPTTVFSETVSLLGCETRPLSPP
jgi:hypothetical protein